MDGKIDVVISINKIMIDTKLIISSLH